MIQLQLKNAFKQCYINTFIVTIKIFYICTEKQIINIFNGCAELVKTGIFPMECGECHKSMKTLDTLIDHTRDNHKNNLLKNIPNEQHGGTYTDDEFSQSSIQRTSEIGEIDLPEL